MSESELWEEFSFLEDVEVFDNWSLENWCKENGERGKLVKEEWDNHMNISPLGVPIKLSEVSEKESRNKYFWICKECGRRYQMTPWCRTRESQGCGVCGKKRGGQKNRKNATLSGNDLLTWCNNHGEFGSTLAKEWDIEKNRELHGISINEISQKSSLEVSWICSRCGNQYTKKVYTRVALGTGCPACNRIGTSFPEQVIYRSMLQVFPDTLSRKKLFENIEYDIYIPSEKVAIEYNGSYWHENKETRDKMKKDLCLQQGIRFLRINADNGCIDMKFDGDEISYNISSSNHKGQLKKIVEYILNRLGHGIEEIDFESKRLIT